MYAGSLAEMNLTAFGWLLYDNLWGLLGLISIVIFPFTWTLLSTVYDALKQHGIVGYKASMAAFNTLFPSFIVMMAVYAVACIPSVPLNIDAWEYNQICVASDGSTQETPVLKPGATGTPLDTAEQLVSGHLRPIDAEVPLLWDIVMRMGAGIGRAMNSAGVCPLNVTSLDHDLRQMTIADPAVRAELGQFTQDCYLPARSKFMQAMQSGTLTTVPTVNDAVNADQYFAAAYREWRAAAPPNADNTEVFNRTQDPDYIGSHFFLQTPGLYAPVSAAQHTVQGQTLHASIPIAGWPYDPIRDCSRITAKDDLGNAWCTSPRNPDYANNYGSPTCDEWWSDPDRGLLQKLRQEAENPWHIPPSAPAYVPNAMSTQLNTVITSINPAATKSDAWLADKIVATALANDPVAQQSILDKLMEKASGVAAWWSKKENKLTAIGSLIAAPFVGTVDALTATGVAAKLASAAADFYGMAWVVKHAYPIAQAYLMMFFIAFLPIMLVASMYDPARLLQFVMLFMAIQFLGPWRYIVEYLDEWLFSIMYPDQWGKLGTDMLMKTPERLLVDITTTSMYTIFPFVLLWLVTLAGMGAAQSAGKVFDSNSMAGFTSGAVRSIGGGLDKYVASKIKTYLRNREK